MSKHAYTAIVKVGGYIIGRADEGTSGYTPEPQFGNFVAYDKAKTKAEKLNSELGLTSEEALLIVLGTMKRWSGPNKER
jgi:hypothetical protein